MAGGGLTALQARVARTVLRAVGGDVALAGGSALLAFGLIDRTTEDVDVFSTRAIGRAFDRLVVALEHEGFAVRVEERYAEFVRLQVGSGWPRRRWVNVDLGTDSRLFATQTTPVGPALDPRELAVDKVLAVFGRAEPRDLCDLYELSRRFDLDSAIRLAAEKDRGFAGALMADMLEITLGRPDADFPSGSDVALVRTFGRMLRDAVRVGRPVGSLGPPLRGRGDASPVSASAAAVAVCDEWMPRARAFCVLRPGHAGRHRSR